MGGTDVQHPVPVLQRAILCRRDPCSFSPVLARWIETRSRRQRDSRPVRVRHRPDPYAARTGRNRRTQCAKRAPGERVRRGGVFRVRSAFVCRSEHSHRAVHRDDRQPCYYKDGWKLLALTPADIDKPHWQLFDVRTDPTELDDLASRFPDKVRELAEAWDHSAWANTVFPLLGNTVGAVRRPEEGALSRPVRLLAGTPPPLERYRSSKLIGFRDFDITVELDGYREGDAGVLVAHGDPQGGYLLYVEDGHLHLGYNAFGSYSVVDAGPLALGTERIGLSVTVVPRLRWDLHVSVDGIHAGQLLGQVQLVGMAPWTGISVGVDARGDLCRGRYDDAMVPSGTAARCAPSPTHPAGYKYRVVTSNPSNGKQSMPPTSPTIAS